MTKSLDSREQVLDRLEKLSEEFSSKRPKWPPIGCLDASTHKLGAYVYEHLPLILEALKRMD